MVRKLSLSERKNILYNKLSQEINRLLVDQEIAKQYTSNLIPIQPDTWIRDCKRQICLHRETQRLMDSIFNGEEI